MLFPDERLSKGYPLMSTKEKLMINYLTNFILLVNFNFLKIAGNYCLNYID